MQDSCDFDLIENPDGSLTLRRSGQDDVADVRIRRAFPWSSADKWISIRSPEGRELVLIEDPATLPRRLVQVIEKWLDLHSFIPKVTQVISVDSSFGHHIWRVRTDRGEVEFRVQEREDIRFLPDGRFLLKDADGNVYELAGLHQLDDKSRRAVEQLL